MTPETMKLLDILESQMLSFAAQATAVADVAAMVKRSLSDGAQGATEPLSREAIAALVNEDEGASELPRTFGDGRGRKRKAT